MEFGSLERDFLVVVGIVVQVGSVMILLVNHFGSLRASISLDLGRDLVGHVVLVGCLSRMFSVIPERFVVGSVVDVVFHLR